MALVLAGRLAWHGGSIDAADWTGTEALVLALLALTIGAGGIPRLGRAATVAAAGLAGLAAWSGVSASYSAVPALARDEALLALLALGAFLLGAAACSSVHGRTIATVGAAALPATLALALCLELRYGAHPDHRFQFGRLTSPIGYVNAEASLALLGFWPALVLAARRRGHPLLRALAFGAATLALATWLMTQSKGGAIALAASAVAVLVVGRGRLRLLVPLAIVTGATLLAWGPLTEPFRATENGTLVHAARAAGTAALLAALGAAAAGLVAALVDRRLRVPEQVRRGIGIALIVLTVAGAVAGAALFLAREPQPVGFAQQKWRNFKHTTVERQEGATHLLTFGSNRYDFWRVAAHEFHKHPIAGIGARGFGRAYLIHKRSIETPERAHSIWFDTLSELGLVGFAFALLAFGTIVLALGDAARVESLATGAFGAAVLWLVHGSGDWIWTFPAITIPFFALAGGALTTGRLVRVRPHTPLLAGITTFALMLVTVVPTWLAARLVDHAQGQPGTAAAATDLRWAKRLDPLSTAALEAQAEQAPTPGRRIALLREAVRQNPRRVELHYALGIAYLDAKRKRSARLELRRAQALDPDEALIEAALARAGARPK